MTKRSHQFEIGEHPLSDETCALHLIGLPRFQLRFPAFSPKIKDGALTLFYITDLALDHATLQSQLIEMVGTNADGSQCDELGHRTNIPDDKEGVQPGGHQEEVELGRG